jgi:hypothetical protein
VGLLTKTRPCEGPVGSHLDNPCVARWPLPSIRLGRGRQPSPQKGSKALPGGDACITGNRRALTTNSEDQIKKGQQKVNPNIHLGKSTPSNPHILLGGSGLHAFKPRSGGHRLRATPYGSVSEDYARSGERCPWTTPCGTKATLRSSDQPKRSDQKP